MKRNLLSLACLLTILLSSCTPASQQTRSCDRNNRADKCTDGNGDISADADGVFVALQALAQHAPMSTAISSATSSWMPTDSAVTELLEVAILIDNRNGRNSR